MVFSWFLLLQLLDCHSAAAHSLSGVLMATKLILLWPPNHEIQLESASNGLCRKQPTGKRLVKLGREPSKFLS
uniref:Secreted protein n=1 Tax=Heterorhabditis bacteriophora TaxID=37862 RepID=A0A1I7XEH3_HETBA